jgi:hypothetical protein
MRSVKEFGALVDYAIDPSRQCFRCEPTLIHESGVGKINGGHKLFLFLRRGWPMYAVPTAGWGVIASGGTPEPVRFWRALHGDSRDNYE